MILLKSKEEIEKIREGGKILSAVLVEMMKAAAPGVTTWEIDELCGRLMKDAGGKSSFLGYRSPGDRRAYPTNACLSVDGEVVHAPADEKRVLKEGQLLKLDVGLSYKGMCTDMAATVGIGRISTGAERLMVVTRKCLLLGIEKTRKGGWISDIGKAVDKLARQEGYSTVKDLVGHGVGRYVHEDPRIPNYFDSEMDPVRIGVGMVLAIEPMINAGDDEVHTLDDDWTVATTDGELSAHWEATVAITEDGTEIMTPIPEIRL